MRPNILAEAGNAPVNDTPITADSGAPALLMSGGTDYNCGSRLGFYNSDDSGLTWRQHCMPVVGLGGCGGPTVAYDGAHRAYIGGIGNCNLVTSSYVFQSSLNNGVTWKAPKKAFDSMFPGGYVDRPWMEADANAGGAFENCVYVSWTDRDSSTTQTRISVAHSCNQGATWSATPVGAIQVAPAVDQFSDLAIGSDGTVYLTWMHCPGPGPTGTCADTAVDMLLSRSLDGGITWAAPGVIATASTAPGGPGCLFGCYPGTAEPVPNTPSVDYDNLKGWLCVAFYTFTATAHPAWSRQRPDGILNRHSEMRGMCSLDGGVHWQDPVVVPGPAHHGWVWLSMNDLGRIAISSLASTGDGSYWVVVVVANSTSALFRRVSSVPRMRFADDGFGGTNIGGRSGSIWTGNTLHMAWMDTRAEGVSSDLTGGLNT